MCMSCSTKSTVIPSVLRSRMCSSSDSVSAGFTPAIGSSNITKVGLVMSARAISRSFRCPPERLAAKSSFSLSNLKRSRISSARSSISSSCFFHKKGKIDWNRDSPVWSLAPSFIFSRTVSRPNAFVSWNVRTWPIFATLCAGTPARSFPEKDHVPVSGLSKPVSRLKRVVFPAPLGPIRAVMAPRGISTCSTSTATRPPNLRETWSATRIGSTFFTPGVASPTCKPVDFCGAFLSGLLPDKGQLPLVANDSLRPDDNDHHKEDSYQNKAQCPCLSGRQCSQQASLGHGRQKRAEERLKHPEDDCAQERPKDGGGPAQEKRCPDKECQRCGEEHRISRRRQDV